MSDTDGVRFTAPEYLMPADERFAYGIETIEIKKLGWPAHNAVLYGALLRNAETGDKFFVTEADLARYEALAKKPDPSV